MLQAALRAGLAGIKRRPGLAVLLYAVGALVALLLSLPVYHALLSATGETGFGPDLARGFDLVLWADIMERAGVTLGAVALQLLWIAPLYLVWKVAAGVGIIYALSRGQVRSFWQGAGRYTGRGLLLALLYGLLLLGTGGLLYTVVGGLSIFWRGEVASFWIYGVFAPTLLITALSLLDLMQDYSRIALVVEHQPVGRAWKTGIQWPFRHGTAGRLYATWFALAAVLLILPALLEMHVTAGSAGSIWLLFGLQQLVLLARAAVTVGWLGSEVAFFEDVRLRETPLLAGDATAG